MMLSMYFSNDRLNKGGDTVMASVSLFSTIIN